MRGIGTDFIAILLCRGREDAPAAAEIQGGQSAAVLPRSRAERIKNSEYRVIYLQRALDKAADGFYNNC